MNEPVVRTIYFSSVTAAIVLFALMMWDHATNADGLLVPIVVGFALVILVLIGLLFVRSQPTPVRVTDRIDYIGDVHDVVDLEGIGPTYAKKLASIGIHNTQQLLFMDDARLVHVTGAAAKTVRNWKAMGQFVKVRGIGPQYAEALVRAGIGSIESLLSSPAATVAGRVQTHLDGLGSTVIGQKVGTKRVQSWQAAARRLTKGPIALDDVQVRPLESKAARAAAG